MLVENVCLFGLDGGWWRMFVVVRDKGEVFVRPGVVGARYEAWTGQGSPSNFIITSAGWPDVAWNYRE